MHKFLLTNICMNSCALCLKSFRLAVSRAAVSLFACLSKLSPLSWSFLPWPTFVKWCDYPLSPLQLLSTIQFISQANSLQPELVFFTWCFFLPSQECKLHMEEILPVLWQVSLMNIWYIAGLQHNFVNEWMNEWLWLVNVFIFKGVGYTASYIPSKFESVQIKKK